MPLCSMSDVSIDSKEALLLQNLFWSIIHVNQVSNAQVLLMATWVWQQMQISPSRSPCPRKVTGNNVDQLVPTVATSFI